MNNRSNDGYECNEYHYTDEPKVSLLLIEEEEALADNDEMNNNEP